MSEEDGFFGRRGREYLIAHPIENISANKNSNLKKRR
jgi:hypothetical protein